MYPLWKVYAALMAVLLIVLPIVYFVGTSDSDMYIVDKGMALSYVDKYDFTHDSVYWFVAGNSEHTYTIFVPSRTWYDYSVGEIYHGGMSQYLIYEGDDGIARYLGDKNYVHP